MPSTKTGFTDFQFSVYDNNSGAATVNLQSIEVISDGSEIFPGGVVSVTFDDSYVDQYSLAQPKMDSLGFRGTAYTTAEAVGSNHSVYMNLSDLRSLQNFSNWEIAGPAYSATNHGMANGFADLTSDQVNIDPGYSAELGDLTPR
ncbi:polysaccharide deacetylase family protein [Actinacidiphila oryziradicis]|uniref:Uncharacterized protein n=1 Tax=Actinacidiphila oryziradicis TaxID=2571141 RepID=A0A4U0RSJ8_9ACTN|nr:hypothetical protein [Actinacidiphila oryziradicis]TJZ99039.1 hypothetical protein FCI23_47135 [Actinacidiphila oryziradicis]